MRVTAIIPVKALHAAKGRLAPALAASERRTLVATMLERVVRACQGCAAVEDVLVVAGDAAAASLAAGLGVRVLVEPVAGLDRALAAADAATAGAEATLVVAADLPLATAADLDRVVAAATAARTVVVAPTVDGGTGALLRRPGAVSGTAYGAGSAAAHLALARAAGAVAVRIDVPALAHDVDTPEQLAASTADLSVGCGASRR